MEDDCRTTVLSVLETVAAAERVDPVDLPPLSETLDPEALNRLFEPLAGDRVPATVEFEYCGYEVRVDGSGAVTAESVGPAAVAAATAASAGADTSEEPLAD
ncbi:hypothetical protein HZS55_18115 [Halosimplex rubrum]|uniref:Halobacterial output domain-containing protein n=1 Tax=Halosimplex rubrum TaxID=869889 RepID=A0A7D5TNL9_9EURY|nr:HalOD1 output domain-containing protein [Halosimplex rubrum]QLH79092.1 hypothetical protein HZS55_18115 [Halosimplex rubrum]